MSIEDSKAWQPPLLEATGPQKMGYLNDLVNATEGIVTKQPGFREMDSAIAMISGRYDRKPVESRSRLIIPRGKRALREVVANISDIRTVDAFTTDNRAQQENVAMFNKVWRSVWFEAKFPRTMRRTTQWFTVGGISYISPVYRNLRLTARNKRGMAFDSFPASDCLPAQLPMNNDVQGAYAWTIIRFMPTFEAHSKFPTFQHLLRPIARRRYSGNAAKDRLALAERFRQDNLGISSTGSNWAEEFNEIRYTYIRDFRVNDKKMPMPMGTPGSLESYIVPYLGQEIPTGEWNRGVRIMRKADIEDCYLYPNLRLMISQRGMQRPMYDDPGTSWHGMFPLARFSADEWPWEPGYSLAKDIYSIDETQQSFERGMDQTAKARFDPALLYDKSAGLNRKTMEAFDPYEERGRLGLEGGISDTTVKTALPESLLNHPGWTYEYAKYLNDARNYILGTDQMANLAEAKMASSTGDVMQEALEDAGPIVKDISHGMEDPMQDIMFMTLSDVLQYYPTGRMMNYVGADGITPLTFDLNPESLIPSHAPQENDTSQSSAFTRMQRCQMFLDNFKAVITPGSLHGIVQTSQKLLLMQLQRSGFMISSETVAKAFDIANYGTSEGVTEIQKWQWEQREKLQFAEQLKELQAGIALQPQGPAAPPQVTPLAPGGAPAPGRPPTGQHAPELKTKASASGPRAVISESG